LISTFVKSYEFVLLAVIVSIVTVVSVVDSDFLLPVNLLDILTRSSAPAIVACGLMLVDLSGEIDISVGSLFGFVATVMGILLSTDHLEFPLLIGIPLVLMVGLLIGLGTGVLVTFGRVPSIVATLGLLGVLRGMALLVSDGKNIGGLPVGLQSATKVGFVGLPLGIWVAVFVIAFTAVMLKWLPIGTRFYAIGSSNYAARMVGLSEWRLKLFAFAYTGLCTSIAVIIDVPRLPRIEAKLGDGFELLVVTCVVVGGVSIAGGRGRISGVVLAVVLMTMLRPVLTFLDIGAEGEKWTGAIQGVFIIAAVVGDHLLTRFRSRSRQGNIDANPTELEGEPS